MGYSTVEHAHYTSMERPKLLQVEYPFAAHVEILALIFSNQKYLFSQGLPAFRLDPRTRGDGAIFWHLDHDHCINFVLFNPIIRFDRTTVIGQRSRITSGVTPKALS